MSAGDAAKDARFDGSCFDGEWLALREPVDHRSRSRELAAMLGGFLAERPAGQPSARAGHALASTVPLVVDLGAGSGSNLRYLSQVLPHPLRWRLLDQDAALLPSAQETDPHDTVDRQVCDLAALSPAALAGADGVTASALLDLVSVEWMTRLAAACAAAGVAVLAALTIDGRIGFSQPDPMDAAVCAWVARDHRRDKGLGVALGGAAPDALVRALRAQDYQVWVRASDWQLGGADVPLARALIAGWQEAARRQSPGDDEAIVAWATRRLAALAGGALCLTVGHQDVLGLPAGAAASARS